MESTLIQATTPIDIIVPVFRGLFETRRCIESVLTSSVRTDFELVVIEDCSPEPDLVDYLKALAEEGRITLLQNAENLGFVSTVNRGMQLHTARDVLLLNSDTEVANDWLDRIHTAAYSAEEIGTVTPFSNNATICSYPYFNGAGAASLPSGISLAELDFLIARTNARQTAEIPTAIGFCMFIKRDCLNEVGYFDEKRFGRGYGEENDFSRNAALLGWRNVLAADVFVFHAGGVSFGDEQSALQKVAMSALLDKHPDYLNTVEAFSQVDPIQAYRMAIDSARIALGTVQANLVKAEQAAENERNSIKRILISGDARLHITHAWGGGIERWIDNFISEDTQTNFILQSQTEPDMAGASLTLWLRIEGKKTKIAQWKLATPIRATDIHHPEYAVILRSLIDELDVKSLIVSSLIGHALEVFKLQLPTIVILHDMYPFCPAFFAHYAGSECTHCDLKSLQTCQKNNPMYYFWHNTKPEWWVSFRAQYATAIDASWVRLVAPSQVSWTRWQQLFPAIKHLLCTVIGHGVDIPQRHRFENQILAQQPRLRIVIPGRLVEHKGLHLISELLPELTSFADVLLLGCGGKGWAFVDTPHVEIVWDYSHEELADKIAAFHPDCALLLSVVPETFSYTLSEMQALGVPVVATNLGAYQERIQHGVSGWLVEPIASYVAKFLHELDENRQQIQVVSHYWQKHKPTSVREMVQRYLAILPSVTSSPHQNVLLEGMVRLTLKLQQEVSKLDEANQHQEQAFLLQKQALEAALAEARHQVSLAEHSFNLEAAKSAELLAKQGQLLSSRSWQITAPLRWLSDRARDGRSKILSLLKGMQKQDGPPPASLTNLPHSEDGSIDQLHAPIDTIPILRHYDVTHTELCEVSGMPSATIWVGLDDPAPDDFYPPELIDFIYACSKQSNAIRFFISDAAFEQVRKIETGESIYRLVTQRIIIRTPAEWDRSKRQFAGHAMVFFGELNRPKELSVCALQRLGCFLIFWSNDSPNTDLSCQKQMVCVTARNWHPAAIRLNDWLATDWGLRQEIIQSTSTNLLPLCSDH
jgi:GT2 family glycosyltransferase/glycosyltransferase involved in cell wall biosynthesis